MRHGQADNNVNRILVGRYIESHLTEYGKQQVSDTAKYLKNMPIEEVFVSPVTRTIETAKIVCKILGKKYKIDERLYEIELGKLVGMKYDDIIHKYGNLFLKFYTENDETLIRHGVETFTSVKQRIKHLLDEIAEKHRDKNILMITHLDLKPEVLYQWHMRNAALTILNHERKIYSLYAVNVMGIHRYMNE
jgi:probable phosphoglycerate mutase